MVLTADDFQQVANRRRHVIAPSMRHVLRAPGGRCKVTLHQGEEGGLKLANEVSSRFEPCRDYEERFCSSDFDLFNAEVFGF